MSSCSDCVLGQVYGGYLVGIDSLLTDRDFFFGSKSVSRYGFDLPLGETCSSVSPIWDELADAWRAEIARRADAANEGGDRR